MDNRRRSLGFPLARLIPALAGLALLFLSAASLAQAGGSELDSKTAAAGLKEALGVGTGRAVDLLGQVDGYLGNQDVRIPMPEKLQSITKALRKLGMDSIVDDMEISMNRAAEAAAPLARDVFMDTIKEMSFEDAVKIVRGSEHEATDYMRERAGAKLGEMFQPIIADQLDAVGATRAFNAFTDRSKSLPFMSRPVFDLNEYVTAEALDGLFLMIAREEEKIRKDPLARTTDLLKTVFGLGEKDESDGKKKTPWWKKVFSRND